MTAFKIINHLVIDNIEKVDGYYLNVRNIGLPIFTNGKLSIVDKICSETMLTETAFSHFDLFRIIKS